MEIALPVFTLKDIKVSNSRNPAAAPISVGKTKKKDIKGLQNAVVYVMLTSATVTSAPSSQHLQIIYCPIPSSCGLKLMCS